MVFISVINILLKRELYASVHYVSLIDEFS